MAIADIGWLASMSVMCHQLCKKPVVESHAQCAVSIVHYRDSCAFEPQACCLSLFGFAAVKVQFCGFPELQLLSKIMPDQRSQRGILQAYDIILCYMLRCIRVVIKGGPTIWHGTTLLRESADWICCRLMLEERLSVSAASWGWTSQPLLGPSGFWVTFF